jgi:RNA polymerase sigma factor (sigma-70 family)
LRAFIADIGTGAYLARRTPLIPSDNVAHFTVTSMGADLPPELVTLLHSPDPVAREEAWAALIRAYHPLLLHGARSLGGDRDAIMDRYAYILSQLRENQFHRLHTYAIDRRTKFSTWLLVVASRLCLDHHRHLYGRARPTVHQRPREKSIREGRKSLVDLVGAEAQPEELEDKASINPEVQLRNHELQDALEAVLATLEPRDRLLLRLRFEQELSVPRIAAVMGFPSPFHAYRRLAQLFEDLRVQLKRRGIENSVA